jgi:hypothetical protein
MLTTEQAAIEQPELKSYDTELADDVRSAFTEVTSKAPADTSTDTPVPTERTDEPRTAAERARDEQGRFAKTDDKPVTAKPDKEVVQDKSAVSSRTDGSANSSDKTQPALTPEQLSAQAAKPAVRPPDDWDVKAKAQWDRLPQVVRDAIGRSTAADPAIAELKPFLERAKTNGQSLASAVQSYVGMEDFLRKDPPAGLLHLAQNLGLTQHQAGRMFADLASRLGVMPQGGQQLPAEGQDAQQEPDPYRALAPVLQPYQQRLDTLEAHIRQQQEAINGQRMSASMSAVEKFRSSPEARYFANVEKDIANLLDKGIVPRTGDYLTDLKTAYDTACRMNPEIHEILTAERFEKDRAKAEADARAAADKARQASRSVTGSPSPGFNGQASKVKGKSYDDDLHNDVLDAIRQVNGRV